MDDIKKFMAAGKWNEKKKGIYTPTDNNVDWDTIVDFLKASGHPVKEPEKKNPQYLLMLETTLLAISVEIWNEEHQGDV